MAKCVGSIGSLAATPAKIIFRLECMSEFVEIDGHAAKLGDVFSYSSENGLLCNTCREAKVAGEYSEGKVWNEDRLSKAWHSTKRQLECGWNFKTAQAGNCNWLAPSGEHRRATQVEWRKKSDPQQVKILMDNILLAIKMNASVLSVQQIYGHIAKYVSIPEHWRSKKLCLWICALNQWNCTEWHYAQYSKCPMAYSDCRWKHKHCSAQKALYCTWRILQGTVRWKWRSSGKTLLQKVEWPKVQGYSHYSGRCVGWTGTTVPFSSKTQLDCHGRALLW